MQNLGHAAMERQDAVEWRPNAGLPRRSSNSLAIQVLDNEGKKA